MPQPTVAELIRAGMADHQVGRLDAAAAAYRQTLARDPENSDALHLLGLVAHQGGRPAEAIDLLRRATKLRPDLPVYWFNLGTVLVAAGADAEAVAALSTAARLRPDYADALRNLASALGRLDRLPESAATLSALARLLPTDGGVHLQRGQALHRLGQWGPAAAAYRRAIAVQPDNHAAQQHLAVALHALRRTDEAIATFRRLLAIGPDALDAQHHGNFLLALQYVQTPPAEVLAESTRWATTHAPPPPPRLPVHVTGRRVRVGYVSPDFADHPVGHLIGPLLAGHDRARFEVTCYSSRSAADAVTARLRGAVERWRDVRPLTDAALADLIRADGIDLLVDLAGHTAHNRLGAFARRPAAVQATYLGYPATTGLAAMDYRLTDALADPPGATDAFHTERLVRLPHCFLCFAPPTDAPPVAAPPALATGHVTFGSFNAAAKLGPATVRLWASVLMAVPRSRLVLKAIGLMDAATRDGLLADLAAAGVSADRVDVLPPEMDVRQHLARYDAVDVGLDPFPYHGTMTTLDALWMGVPTLTLAGPAHVSRVGVSLMTHAGLPDWIASSAEQLAQIAQRWSADVPALAHLRATMRDRLLASPLTDAARHARDVEAAYDGMLERSAPGRSVGLVPSPGTPGEG